MRKPLLSALIVAVIATACSSGNSATTSPPVSLTSTTAPVSTTTTSTVPSTTSTSTTTSSTTTTTTVPPSFVAVGGFGFSLSVPGDWQTDPEFAGVGRGFAISNTGVGLPPSRFSLVFELLAEPLTPAEHIARVAAGAASGENFAVLSEGQGEIADRPTAFVEYVETLFGFDHVRRVEALVAGNRLVVFDLLAPVDVFESQVAVAAVVAGTFELDE